MLTIVCGEDTVKARSYYISLKDIYQKKGYEVNKLNPSQIEEVQLWIGENQNLFSDKQVFFIENLESRIIKSRGRKSSKPKKNSFKTIEEIVSELAQDANIELVDWEGGKQGREIKSHSIAQIKEFKLSASIFKLQDSCFPGNVTNFIQLLREVSSFQDEQFIFIMITRSARSLLLAYDNLFGKTVQSWQQYKLKKQALLWTKTKLLGWYEGLFRIDLSTKSGTNPYGVLKSLEILACHYL